MCFSVSVVQAQTKLPASSGPIQIEADVLEVKDKEKALLFLAML